MTKRFYVYSLEFYEDFPALKLPTRNDSLQGIETFFDMFGYDTQEEAEADIQEFYKVSLGKRILSDRLIVLPIYEYEED